MGALVESGDAWGPGPSARLEATSDRRRTTLPPGIQTTAFYGYVGRWGRALGHSAGGCQRGLENDRAGSKQGHRRGNLDGNLPLYVWQTGPGASRRRGPAASIPIGELEESRGL